jgi:hypothetical protein
MSFNAISALYWIGGWILNLKSYSIVSLRPIEILFNLVIAKLIFLFSYLEFLDNKKKYYAMLIAQMVLSITSVLSELYVLVCNTSSGSFPYI